MSSSSPTPLAAPRRAPRVLTRVARLASATGLALLAVLCAALPAAGCGATSAATTSDTPPAASPAPLPSAQAFVGQVLDFTAPDLREDDVSFSLASLRGHVVLVDFWASWCGPCRQSLPFYDGLYGALKADGFEVVAVNVDRDRELATLFLDEVPVRFVAVWDQGTRIKTAWPLATMPTAFLVDRDGVIRYVHEGFDDTSRRELEAEIASLVQATPHEHP